MAESKMFALGEVKSVEAAEGDPNGEFDVILSAPTLDRDGEVIDAKVFDPLPDHITFDIDHGMSTATTVGSGKPFYDGDVLRVKGSYSSIPRAQEVRTLVREGHIRTTSVAFMAAERDVKDGVTHIVKAELLNGAFVPIPSNRESVVLSAKSYGEALKSGDRDAKAVERLQNIHDFAVENGAVCTADHSDDGGKSVPDHDQATAHVAPESEAPADDSNSQGAPVTPADEAGKSLASEQVESPTATRVEAFLLTL